MADKNILSQLQDLLKNTSINEVVKQAENAFSNDDKKGGLKDLSKVLNMLKNMQGGKILGQLGKMAGMSSLMNAATEMQNSSDDTEEKETMLDELDAMVAVALEDGVITEEEEKMLADKAKSIGIDVDAFLKEVHEKCSNN